MASTKIAASSCRGSPSHPFTAGRTISRLYKSAVTGRRWHPHVCGLGAQIYAAVLFAVQFGKRNVCSKLLREGIPDRLVEGGRGRERPRGPQYRRNARAKAHLEHKLSGGILVNVPLRKQNSSRRVPPAPWQERRVIIVRDESGTSKGETKQTAVAHQRASRRS